MIQLIATLVITFILIQIWTYRDAVDIKKNEEIEHKSGWLMYTMTITLIAPYSIYNAIAAFFLCVALFDVSLNLWRKKKMFYIPEPKEYTSNWDRFWYNYPKLFIFSKTISALIVLVMVVTKII